MPRRTRIPGDEREPVRIALTDDQRRQVFAAIGKDAIAMEVGSESEDDDWVVLVLLSAEPPARSPAERST